MDPDQVALLTEQLGRLADRINARLDQQQEAQAHHRELEGETLSNLRTQIQDIKNTLDDHEKRLRAVQSQSLKNQVILGLATGGSGFLSIAAFIKAVLGGP